MPDFGFYKRSMVISGRRTSLALEAPFWAVVERVASERRSSRAALVQEIANTQGKKQSLASAVRIWALRHVSRPPPHPEREK